MPNVKDVAQYILAKQDIEAGDTISNLKLQKLAFYAQGFNLAINGEPLFDESIEAWDHGPVVPNLYHEYKKYGPEAIPIPEADIEELSEEFTEEQLDVIDEVCEVYGQFSAWKLRNISHNEQPWINKHGKKNNLITKKSMKNYFKTLLEDDDEEE